MSVRISQADQNDARSREDRHVEVEVIPRLSEAGLGTGAHVMRIGDQRNGLRSHGCCATGGAPGTACNNLRQGVHGGRDAGQAEGEPEGAADSNLGWGVHRGSGTRLGQQGGGDDQLTGGSNSGALGSRVDVATGAGAA